MGVLTDLVIGTEADLASVPEDDVPINVLPGVDVKGTGLVAFAMLHEIVCGREFDPSLSAFPFVGDESEDGPWLNRLPDELVTQIAALDDAGVTRVASSWSQTEELQLAGWSAPDVRECVLRIRDLAQRAVAERKPIHMWTCL